SPTGGTAMQRLRFLSIVLLIPAVAVLVAAAGGGGGDTEKPKSGTSGGTTASSGKTGDKGGTTGKSSSGAKTELASTGSGTLKGKVTFDGDPPKPKPIDFAAKKPEDAPH